MRPALSGAVALILAIAAGCGGQAQPAGPATAPPAPSPAVDWKSINDTLFAGDVTNLRRLATHAYVWGMPLVAAANIRANFTAPSDACPGSPLNRFIHRRKLAGPEMRVGVGPNNDTIYSLAWVDLSDGPLVLTAPDFGERYYTFSINMADSSSNQSLGQRTHGSQLPPLFIHGPDHAGPTPPGMVDVASHSRFVNIAGRILVRGSEDYASVHALQDRIMLTSWTDWQAGRRVWPAARRSAAGQGRRSGTEALAFLERLGAALRDGAATRSADTALIETLAPLGLSVERSFDAKCLLDCTERVAGLFQRTAVPTERLPELLKSARGFTSRRFDQRFGSSDHVKFDEAAVRVKLVARVEYKASGFEQPTRGIVDVNAVAHACGLAGLDRKLAHPVYAPLLKRRVGGLCESRHDIGEIEQRGAGAAACDPARPAHDHRNASAIEGLASSLCVWG